MALLRLNLDVQNKRLIVSEEIPDPFLLPELHQEDIVPIVFAAWMPTGNVFPPLFEVLNLSGYSLSIAIGPAGTALAQQTSWTISADAKSLSGSLNLNTAGILAALTSDTFTSQFEIKLSDGTNLHRAIFPVTIRKSVVLAGSPQPIAGDTALGRLEADRTYVRKEMRAGEGMIWQSADGLKKSFEYLDNDGSKRDEPIA